MSIRRTLLTILSDVSNQAVSGRLALTLIFVVAVGCSGEPKGGPRAATFPIKGMVLIDGKAEPQVQVLCHPVSDNGTGMASAAYTDTSGQYSIGTYESGDGAPAGDYKLTFMWGQINLMSGSYGGPDRLNGRYSDPEKSEFTITVKDGQENDMGVITLSTKDE